MDRRYLEVTDLEKRFNGTKAVAGASLSVSEGTTLALLGPSGCGKTTLLRLIAGLEEAESGMVRLAGQDIAGPGVHVPPEQRRVGMVFQDRALFPHMTVVDNVGYGLDRSDRHKATEALEMVGLVDRAGSYPHELSGGQAQRVAVARALAPQPRLLLLDEPFSSLDTELRLALRAEVSALMRDVGMTAVFVTHDQEEAFVVGDEVAVMQDGRILQQGTPTAVYERPVTAWVAGFVGEANVVSAVAEGTTASTAFGEIPLVSPVNGACRLAVRPEHIHMDAGDQGTVAAIEFYGHDTSYTVQLESGPVLVRAMAAPTFQTGDRVQLSYLGPPVAAFDRADHPEVRPALTLS